MDDTYTMHLDTNNVTSGKTNTFDSSSSVSEQLSCTCKPITSCSDLEAAEDGGEDVDLDGLLARRLGALDAVVEVLQHLQAVLVRHAREHQAEQLHRAVNHRHAQRQWPRHSLILQTITISHVMYTIEETKTFMSTYRLEVHIDNRQHCNSSKWSHSSVHVITAQ